MTLTDTKLSLSLKTILKKSKNLPNNIDVLLPVDIFLKYKKFVGKFAISYYDNIFYGNKDITKVVQIKNETITIEYGLSSNVTYPDYNQIAGIIGSVGSDVAEYGKDILLKQAILSKENTTKATKTTVNLRVPTKFNFDRINFVLSFFGDKVGIVSADENRYAPVVFKGERIFVLTPLR
jgi:hypothetical protein